MTVEQFKELMKKRTYVEVNSDLHLHMHEMEQRARKIMDKINNTFHTMEELRVLFSELTGQKVDGNFNVFPPFYTDYGQNIK
ncbi:MAG: sugar O-acetyltransferase, partial [Clostridiales bacterium]|nr:sugar O-acetyltransferase [Clostridiales bacterium]